MANSWFPWCCCGGTPCKPCGAHKFGKLEKRLRVTFSGLPTSWAYAGGRCWKLDDDLPDREYFYYHAVLNDIPSSVTYEVPWTWNDPPVPPNDAINPCRLLDPATNQLVTSHMPLVNVGQGSEDWQEAEHVNDPAYNCGYAGVIYQGFCEIYAQPLLTVPINPTLPGWQYCTIGKWFWVEFNLQMFVRMRRLDNGQCFTIPGQGPLWYAAEVPGSRVPVTGDEFTNGVPLQKRVTFTYRKLDTTSSGNVQPVNATWPSEGTWTCQLV